MFCFQRRRFPGCLAILSLRQRKPQRRRARCFTVHYLHCVGSIFSRPISLVLLPMHVDDKTRNRLWDHSPCTLSCVPRRKASTSIVVFHVVKNSASIHSRHERTAKLILSSTFSPVRASGCKNRPAPFPGRMSYKATKPDSACPVS